MIQVLLFECISREVSELTSMIPPRNNFTITPAWATPGYNPGPISPGTWNVVLGPYESTAKGIDWTLEIAMGFDPVNATFTPTYAPTNMDPSCNGCTEAEEFTWQRGDFHMHTIYSDGKYTPEEQVAIGQSRDLSFVFLSDHNTDTSNQIAGLAQAAYAPDLLVGRAIEVTTRYGHWQAVGLDREQVIDWRYKPGDKPGFAEAAEQVRRAGGFVSVNHPFAECPACNWSLGWESNDAVEVWNGPWDSTDEQAVQLWQKMLVEGKRITAIGGSDSHAPPSVNGLPTSVVKGRGRSQAAIVEGVKAGRVYLVQGPGMDIAFEVVSKSLVAPAQIGDRLSAKKKDARFSAEGLAGQRMCLISDQGYFYNASIVDHKEIQHAVPSGAKFIRAEVRNSTSDEVLALTNPVWFL
jgi:hypothetical protein